MEASQKLSSNLARSHGLKGLVTLCLSSQRHVPVAEIPPFLTRGTPFLRSLLTRFSVVNLAGVVSPKLAGWAWGWIKTVGEEDVDGLHAGRAAPGSHRHPPRQRLGLGMGKAGVARYLTARSQPKCFTVAVLVGLWGAGRQPLNTGRSPRVPTASLVALGDSQLGSMAFSVRGGGGSSWNDVPCEHSPGLVTQILREAKRC